MGLISAANLNSLIDYLGFEYKRVRGVAGDGIGESGDGFAMANALALGQAVITGSSNADLQSALQGEYQSVVALTSAIGYWKSRAGSRLRRLQAHIRSFAPSAAVTTLESYLAYLNTGAGGTWNALQDHNWRTLYNSWIPGQYPAAYNLYQEVLQGTFSQANHLYTSGLFRYQVTGAGTGTPTKATVEGLLITDGAGGAKIDGTKYAGGFGYMVITSFGGAAANVTITGTVYDPASMSILTGRTMITNVTGNSAGQAIVVGAGTAPANFLLLGVDSIAVGAAMTAGNIYVEARRPSGRSLIV